MPLKVASSLQHLLFVHRNQRIIVQAVTQKIMSLDLPQSSKFSPVIRRLVWNMMFSLFSSPKLPVSYQTTELPQEHAFGWGWRPSAEKVILKTSAAA